MLPRFNLFGVDINLIDFSGTVKFLSSYDFSKTGYICLSDTYVVTLAHKDDELRTILNHSLLTLPDGKPIEFYARLNGLRGIATVSGYWLIKELLRPGIRHYFYGSDARTLCKISASLARDYADAEILGFKAPPFMTVEEIRNNPVMLNDFAEIDSLKPDIIWIGVSSPKQDILMAAYHDKVQQGIMIGVGGVFDYLAENTRISPEWIKQIGFRWFYRFIQEPGRLWRKYLFGLSGFTLLVLKEYVTGKKLRGRAK